MLRQQQQLIDQLQINGWHIANREANNLEWWADEIWVVESEWSPQRLQIYLTFLVDPEWDKPRKKGQGVWPIGTALQRPNCREKAEGSPLIPLRPKWETRLPKFISALSDLRHHLSTDNHRN